MEKLLYIFGERKIHESAQLLNQFLDHNIWPIQVINTLGVVGNKDSVERLRKKLKSDWDLEREAARRVLPGLEQDILSRD